MLNEAALEAVRRDAAEVAQADVYNAVDRVLQVPRVDEGWARVAAGRSARGLLAAHRADGTAGGHGGRQQQGWLQRASTAPTECLLFTPLQGIRRPSLPDSFGVKDNLAYHEGRLIPHTQLPRLRNQHLAALPALLESDWRTRPALCNVAWPARDALHSDCLMLHGPAIRQFW